MHRRSTVMTRLHVEGAGHDVRYGLRLLRKGPAFTLAAVLSLALGIGVTTAVASLVAAWLLRRLPYPEADRLVVILRSSLDDPDHPQIFPLHRDFVHWVRESRSFERLSGAFWRSYLVAGHGEPDELNGMIVTDDLFETFGVRAVIGRTSRAATSMRARSPSSATTSGSSVSADRRRPLARR